MGVLESYLSWLDLPWDLPFACVEAVALAGRAWGPRPALGQDWPLAGKSPSAFRTPCPEERRWALVRVEVSPCPELGGHKGCLPEHGDSQTHVS